MRRLPARQEQVLLLHTLERLSYRQIAERLGIKQGAVCMRIRRARLRILEHVRARIGAADESRGAGAPR